MSRREAMRSSLHSRVLKHESRAVLLLEALDLEGYLDHVECSKSIKPVISPSARLFFAYCRAENFVGDKNMLATLSLIGPSFSLFALASVHSGSTKNAFHFFSRSASESHFKM